MEKEEEDSWQLFSTIPLQSVGTWEDDGLVDFFYNSLFCRYMKGVWFVSTILDTLWIHARMMVWQPFSTILDTLWLDERMKHWQPFSTILDSLWIHERMMDWQPFSTIPLHSMDTWEDDGLAAFFYNSWSLWIHERSMVWQPFSTILELCGYMRGGWIGNDNLFLQFWYSVDTKRRMIDWQPCCTIPELCGYMRGGWIGNDSLFLQFLTLCGYMRVGWIGSFFFTILDTLWIHEKMMVWQPSSTNFDILWIYDDGFAAFFYNSWTLRISWQEDVLAGFFCNTVPRTNPVASHEAEAVSSL